uniref:Uncharacterized protein n=1 Tax=Haplochromis burtoni TaxID=8153 RepID=A0A3Q2WHX6_HAPBU
SLIRNGLSESDCLMEGKQPPNSSDGSTAVTASEASGGDLPPVGATGAQTSRLNRGSTGGGEPDSPSWCRTPKSFDVFQSRTIFRFPRRSSSGYFSSDCDSLPSSPLSPKPVMSDKAIQTPSLTGQVLIHALQRMGEVHGEGPGTQHGEHRLFMYNSRINVSARTVTNDSEKMNKNILRMFLYLVSYLRCVCFHPFLTLELSHEREPFFHYLDVLCLLFSHE